MLSGVLMAIAMVLVIPVGVMFAGAIYSAVLSQCFPAPGDPPQSGPAE